MAKITIEIPDHLIPSSLNPKGAYVLSDGKIKMVTVETLVINLHSSDTDQNPTKDNPYPDLDYEIKVGGLNDVANKWGTDTENFFPSKQALIDSLF